MGDGGTFLGGRRTFCVVDASVEVDDALLFVCGGRLMVDKASSQYYRALT